MGGIAETYGLDGRRRVEARRRRSLLLTACLFCMFVLVLPHASATQKRVTTFLPNDGLAGDHIRSIVKTDDNNVWFGCWGRGVSRYNGYRWTSYSEVDGLPCNDVRALAVDAYGWLWCATTRGIAYFDGTRWRTVSKDIPPQEDPSVMLVCARRDGSVWFVMESATILQFTPNPVVRYRAGTSETLAPTGTWSVVAGPGAPFERSVLSVMESSEKEMWVGLSDHGIMRYRDGEWHSEPGVDKAGEFVSLFELPDKTICGAGSKYFVRFAGNRKTFSSYEGEAPTCMNVTPQNVLYLGTAKGLSFDDGSGWQGVDFDETLGEPAIVTLACFEEGEVWAGTRYGAFRITGNDWERSVAGADRVSYTYRVLYTDPDTQPVLAANDGTLYQRNRGSWRTLLRLPTSGATCYGLAKGGAGQLWVLFDDRMFLISLADAKVVADFAPPGFTSWYRVYQAPSGRLFAFDSKRVCERVDGKWEDFRAQPFESAVTLLEDDRGTLWILWSSICERLEGDRWITLDEGTPDKPLRSVETLAQTKGYPVLLGIGGQGIFQFVEGKLKLLASFEGAPSRQSHALLQANDGTLWVGNRQMGVSSYSSGFWAAHMQERGVPAGRVLYLGEDPQGAIWAQVAGQGVFKYMPGNDSPETEIQIAPETVAYRERAVFHFGGTDRWNKTPREELRYSWRVIQADSRQVVQEWTPFSPESTAVLPRLGPGTYTFEVYTMNTDRNLDIYPAAATFNIERPFWFHATFLAPVGALALAVAVLLYLWQRKHSSLVQSEARYRDILNSINDVVYTLTLWGDIAYISPGVEAILGCPPEELFGTYLGDYMEPADEERFRERLQGLSGESTFVDEYRFLNWAGELRWLRLSFRVLWREGRVADIKGVATDISETKAAEHELISTLDNLEHLVTERTREVTEANDALTLEIEERRYAEEELRRSEERLRTIIDNSPIAMALIDDRERTEFLNSRFVEIFGYTLGDVPNLTEWRSKAFPEPEYRQEVERAFRHLDFSEDGPLIQNGTLELRVTCRLGNVRIVELRAARIASKSLFILNDVTERREAEERERAQREQSLQASKLMALGTLVSGVAHEINNPNHIILMGVSTVRRVWEDVQRLLDGTGIDDDSVVGGLEWSTVREQIPQLLQRLKRSSDRIKDIVQDLRSYVGPEAAVPKERIRMDDVVRNATTWLSALIRESTDHFHTESEPSLPSVSGNQRRLEQVLVNLIQNACQALPSREQAVRVSMRCDRETERIVVEVVDEGAGMTSETLKHVTDPFYTTKRATGGTGLGVSIAASIVREHGGTLTFYSEVGKGTTARIELPVSVADVAAKN